MELTKSKTLRNAAWLIGGRLVNKVLSFLVGILTARYLGPGNYGLIGYAAAYTTFCASVCNLGINSVIIKNFSDHPGEEGQAIGTTLVLRAASSALSAVMIVGVVALVDGSEPETVAVATLSSVGLIFQVFDTFKQWFQSRLRSRYAAIAGVLSYIAASAYKIYLLATGKSVCWFALATSVDYLAAAVFLLLAYRKDGGPRLSFSWAKARKLLGASHSYIVSGLMVSVYAATDKLMLKHMLDDMSVGYYTMAVSVSNAWVFILQAVIDSMYPSVIRAHGRNDGTFQRRNRQLYAIVIYMALAVSAGISLLAEPVVKLLYGEAYLPAAAPLRIVVWYTAFSFLGVARNAWVVCENAQKYLKYIYIGSALVNVALNALLIPRMGTTGAAWASLLTQAAGIVLFPALLRPLRPNAKLMLEAAIFKDTWEGKTSENYGK